jgi:tetratricopeptide (TPR) repeat protein
VGESRGEQQERAAQQHLAHGRSIQTPVPRFRLSAFIIAGVALSLRLLHVWQMHGSVFFSVLMGDSRGYDAWAREIAAGAWLGRDVFYQAPLYPYFLAAVYAVFGHDLLAVRVIQAVLGSVACVALGSAVHRLVSPRAGLVAGLMLACYPPAIFFDGLIQKSVLDVLFACLILAVIARLTTEGDDARAGAALGVVLGAFALTRENALLLAAIVLFWMWTRRGLRAAAVVAAGLAIVLVPVAARNYAVGGGFYLTTSQFGSNLYIGNNPQASGSYMSLRAGRGSPEFERLDATALAEQAAGQALTPAQVSSYWTNRTLAFITSDPGSWLRLLARKAWLLINATEIIDTEAQESHAEYSWPLGWLGPIWHFGVLLPLGVLGMAVLWRERRRLWIVYALTAAYAMSVVVFFVVARYRLPLVPFVALFAAAGMLALGRRHVPAMAAAAAIALAANWPLHSAASQQAITENNLGTALQEAGRIDDAIGRYQRALALDPAYTPALNNLGAALRAAGRTDEAIAAYAGALAQDPDRVGVLINLGNARMAQGRVGEAIESFRRALALAPQSPRAIDALANALYDAGTVALELGRHRDAAAALEESLRLRPESAPAHNNLGIALASQGRLHDAIPHWERAVQLEPAFTDARRNLERARQAK